MYYLQLHYGQVKKYLNFKGENNFWVFTPTWKAWAYIFVWWDLGSSEVQSLMNSH